ncbi:NAD-dependent epimerase/dehydratase family protein [Marinigracilibium pacificum]|uniref:Epimerase n=1 Tax=Marinigracilibium pacificum TaxID=2729599 RepID=A0A848IVR2_9BACT|nr:NAD-dependent epimerase/dehydratase family protein [Marinigracilibium pacificum]NMM47776.1 epimerase [Marinigracilibium pacificum]
MKVIITGASGMVGKGVLLECIEDEDIDKILLIGRSVIEINHPKVEYLIHKDFNDFSSLTDKIAGYDACFMCMGISAAGLTEEEYTEITYNYTLSLTTTLFKLNPQMTITYVSGQGTDSTEKGRVMWARVKGKTENTLLNIGFKGAYMYRPGAIIPLKGIKSRTKMYQFMYDYFLWLIKIIKKMSPNSIVNTTQMGKSMIYIAKTGYSEKILNPVDIIKTSELYDNQ